MVMRDPTLDRPGLEFPGFIGAPGRYRRSGRRGRLAGGRGAGREAELTRLGGSIARAPAPGDPAVGG